MKAGLKEWFDDIGIMQLNVCWALIYYLYVKVAHCLYVNILINDISLLTSLLSKRYWLYEVPMNQTEICF